MRINTPNRPKKEIKNTQTYSNEEIKKTIGAISQKTICKNKKNRNKRKN